MVADNKNRLTPDEQKILEQFFQAAEKTARFDDIKMLLEDSPELAGQIVNLLKRKKEALHSGDSAAWQQILKDEENMMRQYLGK